MKNFWIAVVILALAAVPVLAQEHRNEKKASGEITITTPTKVGGKMLRTGTYRIACNRREVTFTRLSNEQKVALPCKGKEMERKAASTELYSNVDRNGVRVLDKLLLRGSNVEHVF